MSAKEKVDELLRGGMTLHDILDGLTSNACLGIRPEYQKAHDALWCEVGNRIYQEKNHKEQGRG